MIENSGKLLVVDDNEMNRDMFARRLVRKGFDVAVADGARELLQRVRDNRPDVILLDIEMPEISGLDALKALRESYSQVELPVIMVTAKSQSDDIAHALNLGASDYITKPIDFPVALARIHTQLCLRRAEEGLRESEQRYALAAEAANDGLWDWNAANGGVYFSSRWKAMLGYEENEIGIELDDWIARIHEADRDRVRQELADHRDARTGRFESEYRILHRDGSFRWMRGRGLAVRDDAGRVVRMVGSQTDITESKLTDPLTGLPNRLLLLDRVAHLLEYSRRDQPAAFALLFLDLDNFKVINDSFGQLAGDALLVAVAERLTGCLRAADSASRAGATIARLDGDAFGILLEGLKDPSDATRVADRIRAAIGAPFLGHREVFLSASMGIALSRRGYDRAEDALLDAETAMHHAKSFGKARCQVFDAEMRTVVMKRLELETDLRRALQRGEFENYYQPIVSLSDGRISGFEALVRWRHPARGIIGPTELIPLAEEIGVIQELGWRILCEACRQIAVWNRTSESPLLINVNISVKQFLQPDLPEKLASLLREAKLATGVLNLELTESMLIGDPAGALDIMSRMRALGVLLSIDDFGTGYSSLSYLHQLPLNSLKIDRSFIAAMTEGAEGLAIVRTIVKLAKELRFRVVAEGIETPDQLALLKELGCDCGQGYYFAKPMSADDASAFLEAPCSL